MDFAKLNESFRKHREIEARLGKAVWTYRCLRRCGCKDAEYVTNLPPHLMKCMCELPYHGGEHPSHGRTCGAYTELIARSPAAVELDAMKEAPVPDPPGWTSR